MRVTSSVRCPSDPRHHVVVVGSGFSGLFATRALRRADVDVTVVARSTPRVLLKQANVTAVRAEATALDLDRRTVTLQVLGREQVTHFDSLVVAAGAGQSRSDRFHRSTYAPVGGGQAAEVRMHPLGRTLAEQTGAGLDLAGGVAVCPNLTLPGHPDVFVVGDMMSRDRLPRVAQVAIQSGRYAALTIDRRLRGRTAPKAFRYRDSGTMAAIGRLRSVASVGPGQVTGFVGWQLRLAVHRLRAARPRINSSLRHRTPLG